MVLHSPTAAGMLAQNMPLRASCERPAAASYSSPLGAKFVHEGQAMASRLNFHFTHSKSHQQNIRTSQVDPVSRISGQ
eukprot:1159215-Pelagomonas_calceolata.AAC.11